MKLICESSGPVSQRAIHSGSHMSRKENKLKQISFIAKECLAEISETNNIKLHNKLNWSVCLWWQQKGYIFFLFQ